MHGKKQVMRKYMMDVRTDWDTKAEIGAHKKRKHCFPGCPYTHQSPPVSSRSGVIPGVIRENCAVLCVSRHMTYF